MWKTQHKEKCWRIDNAFCNSKESKIFDFEENSDYTFEEAEQKVMKHIKELGLLYLGDLPGLGIGEDNSESDS